MTKYRIIPISHHISDNSHTCRSDARTFGGTMHSLEVTLTVCYNLGFLGSQLVKCFSFDHFWVLTNFGKVFSVSKVVLFLLSDVFCSWFKVKLRSPVLFLISAVTSRLAGSALHWPFWLSLIAQHRRCQWRSQWFVQFVTTVFHWVIC